MTDDDKALVERLRDFVIAEDIDLAADRIEALSAENERLKNLLRDCHTESISWLDARDAALGETE